MKSPIQPRRDSGSKRRAKLLEPGPGRRQPADAESAEPDPREPDPCGRQHSAAEAAERDPRAAREIILREARALGFHRVAIAPVPAPLRHKAYREWLDRDFAGTMTYLGSALHVDSRRDLRELSPEARTVVVVALAYPGHDRDAPIPLAKKPAIRGFVARYARGEDYHTVLKRKLYALAARLREHLGRDVVARPCVDSAPVLERDLAEQTGIGFTAKNTMLIVPGLGSYVLLGELLLDVEVPAAGNGAARPRCGSCSACIDACPTGAFADDYVLDARRCISYLTIEHQGSIPIELRDAIGTMIFGCDICQEVCPFNAAAPARSRPAPELSGDHDGERGAPDLLALLERGASQRRRYLRGSAMPRVSREQLLRNVCVALGNAGDPRAIPALEKKLSDASPLVRAHAAWALGRLGAGAVCERALETEPDDEVRAALRIAAGWP